MYGFREPHEDTGDSARFLHVRGTLGFHAPFYALNREFDKDVEILFSQALIQIEKNYQEASRIIAQLVSIRPNAWPQSLITKMLGMGRDEFEYVDLVEEAAAWDIELVGLKEEKADHISIGWECYHRHRDPFGDDMMHDPELMKRMLSEPVESGQVFRYLGRAHSEYALEKELANQFERYSITLEEMGGSGCEAFLNRHHGFWCLDWFYCKGRKSGLGYPPKQAIVEIEPADDFRLEYGGAFKNVNGK
jgi:hypothetical protein